MLQITNFFLEIVSKCTQTYQLDAKKFFWEEVYALSAPATWEYIFTGNAFTRNSTVMPHVILEASVYPSACPSHSAIVSKLQARSRNLHLSFIKDSRFGSVKAFPEIWTKSSQPRKLNKRGGGRKICSFNQQVAISQKRCGIRSRLISIANRKSYTRFRLVPKAMTLDDLEQQDKGIIDFRFCDFGLWLLL